jgi:hypothetical protein
MDRPPKTLGRDGKYTEYLLVHLKIRDDLRRLEYNIKIYLREIRYNDSD